QGTEFYVAVDGKLLGSITLADAVKEQTPAALEGLKALGVRRNIMLTGDKDEVARQVAEEVGIDEYFAQLLPQDKVAHVEELLEGQEAGQTLAAVGDGINDAPLLTRADVGIAMGALGSDAAIEAADVVLMEDNPSRIVDAVKISRRVVRISRQNIVFALGVKAIVLVLGIIGIANMWMAVFADVGVAIIAILNSLRVLRTK
ncbi:MAG: HAD-IC family P-type ATPase, partial [Coriobacteriaceae bacterium]|nr:HAD-IC family P-type ATPase [Coriobacteriaceae bacterium]